MGPESSCQSRGCRHSIGNEVTSLDVLYLKSPLIFSVQPLVSSSEDIKKTQEVKLNNPPKLNWAFRILLPLSSNWRNIGLLLELDDGFLRGIDSECRGVPDNCLREMLSLWLKQTDPTPTTELLAKAVEVYNPAVARMILSESGL